MKLSSLFLPLALALAACSSTPAPVDPSAGLLTDRTSLAGTWTGTWTEQTTDSTRLEGTASLTIDPQGKVNGALDNQTLNLKGAITGVLNDKGYFTGEVDYPNAKVNGEGQVGVKGAQLIGTLDIKRAGQKIGTLSFALSH